MDNDVAEKMLSLKSFGTTKERGFAMIIDTDKLRKALNARDEVECAAIESANPSPRGDKAAIRMFTHLERNAAVAEDAILHVETLAKQVGLDG